jgi:hypothetical protein
MFKQFFGADFDIKAWEEGGMEIDWGLGRFTPPAALFPVLLCLFLWYFLGSTNPGRGEVQFRCAPPLRYSSTLECVPMCTNVCIAIRSGTPGWLGRLLYSLVVCGRLSPQGQYQVLRESLQQKTPYYVDQYFEKAYTSRPTVRT